MSGLDRRLHAYRPDLAAEGLRGRVDAPRFVEGTPMRVAIGCLDLRRRPGHNEALNNQLLFGEEVILYDEADGWAWVQSRTDRYVGYVERSGLAEDIQSNTHSLTALRTFLYPEPDLKKPPLGVFSITAALNVEEQHKGFAKLATGGWVFAKHIAPLDSIEPDYVETALKFLGTPYLWGGRSSVGLDCSALLQLSLARAGLVVLRDSDQQQETLGENLGWITGETEPERGDLLHMAGHCAIALDAKHVVHATSFTMSVICEEIEKLEARVIAKSGKGITGRRRSSIAK